MRELVLNLKKLKYSIINTKDIIKKIDQEKVEIKKKHI